MIAVVQFAHKFSQNLGLPDYFEVEKHVALTRESDEVFFTLDHSLYQDE